MHLAGSAVLLTWAHDNFLSFSLLTACRRNGHPILHCQHLQFGCFYFCPLLPLMRVIHELCTCLSKLLKISQIDAWLHSIKRNIFFKKLYTCDVLKSILMNNRKLICEQLRQKVLYCCCLYLAVIISYCQVVTIDWHHNVMEHYINAINVIEQLI